jgi:hypothetical protein
MSQKFLSDVTLSTVTGGSMLKLDANGKIVAAVDGTDYISASATGYFTASSGSGIYYDGDVRIGTYQTTVAPDARLHVFDYQTTEPKLLIEDGNTGDASMQFKVSTQSYTLGIDNSDSDKFVLAAGDVLGTGNLLEITSGGLAAFQNSVLVKGTLYINNQEEIQQGATEKIATFQNLGVERGYFEVTDAAKGYFYADGFKTGASTVGFLKSDGTVDTGDFFSGAYGDLTGTPTLGSAAAADTTDFAPASHNHDSSYVLSAGGYYDENFSWDGTHDFMNEIKVSGASATTTNTTALFYGTGGLVEKRDLGSAAFAATGDFDAAGTAASEAGDVQDNLDSLVGTLGTAAYTASTDYATASHTHSIFTGNSGYIEAGGNNAAVFSITSRDRRAIKDLPRTYPRGLYLDFKNQDIFPEIGEGGYRGQMIWRSYGSETDLSGGQPLQMVYTQSGNLYFRLGTGLDTWQEEFQHIATRQWVSDQSYLTSLPAHHHDARYYTQTQMDTLLSGKLSTSGGTVYKQTDTTGTSGTSFLTIHNNVGGDISQQQSFVDFMFTDTNANFTPQVRIGAQVGRDADANAISKEGAGAFVVYTGNGSDESGGGSLSESFRVSYNGNITAAGDIYSGTSKIATETFATGEAEAVQGNLDSLVGSLGTAAYTASTDYAAASHTHSEYLTSVPAEYLTQTEGDARYLQSLPSHNHDGRYMLIGGDGGLFNDVIDVVAEDVILGFNNYTNAPYPNHSIVTTYVNQASAGRRAQFFHADSPAGGLWWRARQGDSIGWHDWQKVWTSYNFDPTTFLTSSDLTGYATESYVNTAVSNLVDSAPTTLDTLNELAAALGDDPNFATTVTNSIATKLPLAGGTMTGNIVMQNNAVNFKTSGSSTVPQFYGHRSTVDLNSRAWDSEGGWAYTTFDASSANTPSGATNNANGLLSFNTHVGTYGHQLALTNGGEIFSRSRNGGSFSSWRKLWTEQHFGSGQITNWDTAYGWGNHADAGYLTTVPATFSATQITLGSGVVLRESSDRADLLSISSSTSSWGGLQVTNSSNEALGSFMVNDSSLGLYDDQQNEWIMLYSENAGTQFFYNGSPKMVINSAGAKILNTLELGNYSDTNQGILALNGNVADRQSIIKTTNGNLHIDSHDGYSIYLNYYTGTADNIIFGNGNGGTSGAKVTSGGVIYATGGNSGNWNTAYSWGNHAGLYLGISAKAADSNLLDGLDSSVFMRKSANSVLDMNNFNIQEVNHITFNDSGFGEGLQWQNWLISDAPDNLSNAAGNLQISSTADPTIRVTVDGNGNFYPSRDRLHLLGLDTNRWQIVFCEILDSAGQHEKNLQNPEGEKSVGEYETGTVLVWKGGKNVPCTTAADHMRMGIAVKGIDSPLIQGAEPVLVTGKVNEGDYLVTSSKEGHAEAISPQFMRQHGLYDCVLGKALESAEGESHLVKTWINI